MNFSLIVTCMLVGLFMGESNGRAIDKPTDSHQPTPILRNARSAPERSHTEIVREERSIHPETLKADDHKTQIVRAERSTKADAGKAEAPDQRKTLIVRDRRATDTSDNISLNPLSGETRPERSPDFSPFGRAEGEASAPRRKARSPDYVPFGRAGH